MGNSIWAGLSKNMDGQTSLHRFRYHLGRGFIVPSDTVLDLGCGQGYGAEMFADVAYKVIGIDIDKDQIMANREREYPKSNITYLHGNLEEIAIPKADVACQFENLEHLYRPDLFAEKLKKSVRKFIIVSVPFGCEKLISVGGDIQADLDSTHHAVFDTPNDVDKLFIDDTWKRFYDLRIGVTYIGIYYNTTNI